MPVTRRVHFDNLRSVDPETLDILIQDALRRPLVQLTTSTVADLCALSEVESLPKALRRALVAFAGRMGPEIADLPDGEPIVSLLGELEALPPARVPKVLRAHVAREIEARHELEGRIRALLDAWAKEEPEVVIPGSGKPVIHRVKVLEEPVHGAPAPKAPKAPGEKKAKAPRATPVKLVDRDRNAWIRDMVLERLEDYHEQGLREDVLVAGVRHRGRTQYPDLTGVEVVGVLRDLQTAGRVKHSAGRWKRNLGW